MKIENNGTMPVSSRPTEAARRVDKKDSRKDVRSAEAGQDKAEMSENARLLAKARTALGNVEETNTEDLLALRKQIDSGDYTVQVGDLARKLISKLYPK